MNNLTNEQIKQIIDGADPTPRPYRAMYFADTVKAWQIEPILKEILTLRERVAELEKGWISVDERLPESMMCLACTNQGAVSAARFSNGKFSWENDEDWTDVTRHISHWSNYPQPPKESTNE